MSAMAPLFTPPATQPELHEAESMITTCFESFYEAGILEAVDVQVAARLSRLSGETSAHALLGFALAIRAPRHGHICVDIHQAQSSLELPPQDGEEPVELHWKFWTAFYFEKTACASSPRRSFKRAGATGWSPAGSHGCHGCQFVFVTWV